jgi:glutathione S-transferase
LPTTRLWHIPVSHFNEKVRWTLDLKGVDHERRAPTPPAHMAVAMWLTRGRANTVPLLELDGEAIADSTAIIAALERRYPDPPLYPADPGERARALALEDYFDEELGPYSRQLAFHEMRGDPDALQAFAGDLLPAAMAKRPRARAMAAKGAASFSALRYDAAADDAADRARAQVLAALDRLEEELEGGSGDYLVGDRFSIADLTAAALFVPVVKPPQGPVLPSMPESYERWRAPLASRPGYRWVEEIFRRHRRDARRP